MSIQEIFSSFPAGGKGQIRRELWQRCARGMRSREPTILPLLRGSSGAVGCSLRRKWLESHPPKQKPLPRGSPRTVRSRPAWPESLRRDPPVLALHTQGPGWMERAHTLSGDWLEPERRGFHPLAGPRQQRQQESAALPVGKSHPPHLFSGPQVTPLKKRACLNVTKAWLQEWLSELRHASAPLNPEGTMTATRDTEWPHLSETLLETELSSGHRGRVRPWGVPQFSRGREVRPVSLRFTQGGALPQRTGLGGPGVLSLDKRRGPQAESSVTGTYLRGRRASLPLT